MRGNSLCDISKGKAKECFWRVRKEGEKMVEDYTYAESCSMRKKEAKS